MKVTKFSLLVLLAVGLLAACGPTTETGQSAAEIMRGGQDNINAIPLAEEEAAVSVETEANVSAAADDGAVGASGESANTGSDTAVSVTRAAGEAEETYAGLPTGFTESGHPYIGDIDAPVVIEEYSDYQCPYCARFYAQTMSALKTGAVANGEAVIVFYDFPLSFHPQAEGAANAARCAGEQGSAAYWQMHDALFESVDAWGNDNANAVFKQLAADLELDSEPFGVCVDEFRYRADIQSDLARGQAKGVTGTPSFFLNGQILVGALPLQTFNSAIAKVQSGESIAEAPSTTAVEDIEIPPFEMPEPSVLSDEYAAVIGAADAPITIVEFSDYQCPYCNRHFLQTMPTIMSEMIEAGRVQYVFKDFPLDQIHPDARDAAQAARCAGEQEAYWEMHDQLFNTQTVWGGQADLETIFTGYAGELGLDEAEFATCYASNSYAEAIQTNYDEGVQLGVTGTPAFFINGYFISGARPYELFELIVDAIETDTLEDLYREAYDQQVEAYKQQLAQEQAQAERANTPIDVPIDESPAIGSPDAPITIIEYTDFQCPYCSRHFSETFPQIKENYIDKGLVRYVFKDFPLSFHPQAQLASEAARCAADQEAFLAMHNQLFASQSEWGNNGARDVFVGYAGELGLDVDSFTTCLDSGKYTEIVKADLNEGASIGITGTPSFVVNGQLVVGALPYSTFDQALQGILEEQNNSN